jgi:putative flippase GtrA
MGSNEPTDTRKGRFKRLGGVSLLLAAVILIILRSIYPLVPPTALATPAVLAALAIAAVFNFFYERRGR